MKNGTYKYYTIQHRVIARSPWLHPEEPLREVPPEERGEWITCGENWNRSTIPHKGKGNDWRPVDREACGEWRGCRDKTDEYGWWSLPFALEALARLKKDGAGGVYDSFDAYSKRCMAVRYEFRLCVTEMTYDKKTVPVASEEIVFTD